MRLKRNHKNRHHKKNPQWLNRNRKFGVAPQKMQPQTCGLITKNRNRCDLPVWNFWLNSKGPDRINLQFDIHVGKMYILKVHILYLILYLGI